MKRDGRTEPDKKNQKIKLVLEQKTTPQSSIKRKKHRFGMNVIKTPK